MSVLERESVSRHPCANLGAHGWESGSPVAFLALRLRSAVCQASSEEEGSLLSVQRLQLRSLGHGGKHLGGGLVLALPGLRALEKAALPPCLSHRPVSAVLGGWGPGGVPFT